MGPYRAGKVRSEWPTIYSQIKYQLSVNFYLSECKDLNLKKKLIVNSQSEEEWETYLLGVTVPEEFISTEEEVDEQVETTTEVDSETENTTEEISEVDDRQTALSVSFLLIFTLCKL